MPILNAANPAAANIHAATGTPVAQGAAIVLPVIAPSMGHTRALTDAIFVKCCHLALVGYMVSTMIVRLRARIVTAMAKEEMTGMAKEAMTGMVVMAMVMEAVMTTVMAMEEEKYQMRITVLPTSP